MKLLRDLPQPNYPADYLTARIKGRRAILIHNRQLYIENPEKLTSLSDEEIWRKFIGELHWLYGQMNSSLRFVCRNVITYFEMRTLFLCLRFAAGARKKAALTLLSKSLIHPQIRKLFDMEQNSIDLVKSIIVQLVGKNETAKDLQKTYSQKGISAFENLLYSSFLAHAIAETHPPPIDSFLRDLIDLRNTLSYAKYLRWRGPAPPRAIPGGRKTGKRLFLEYEKNGQTEIDKEKLQRLETLLILNLTKNLHRAARTHGTIYVILDYLWQQYIETKNLGTLLHGQDLPPDVLAQGVIQ